MKIKLKEIKDFDIEIIVLKDFKDCNIKEKDLLKNIINIIT